MARRQRVRSRKLSACICGLIVLVSCGYEPTPPRDVAIAGERADTLWLAGFESDNELEARWSTQRSRLILAESSPEGRGAATAVFEAQSRGASSIELSLPAVADAATDWRAYGRLVWFVHNPQRRRQRLILQLVNEDNQRYKENLFIGPGERERFELDVDFLADYIDVSRIHELSFYQWKPDETTSLTIDGIRLEGLRSEPLDRKPLRPAPLADTTWRVGWAPSLVKTLRDPARLEANFDEAARMSLARRERESVQIVILGPPEGELQVRAQVGPLEHEDGVVRIPSESVEIREVAYVRTERPDYPVSHVGEWPDPLPRKDSTRVSERSVSALWLTVYADEGLPAGRYAGSVTIAGSDGARRDLGLEIRIWDFSLPETPSLATAFDLYRPRLVDSYEAFVPGGASWRGRAAELEQAYFFDMLRHRIDPVVGFEPTTPDAWPALQRLVDQGLSRFGVGTRGGTGGNTLWPAEAGELDSVMSAYRRTASLLERHDLLDRAYVYAYDEPEVGSPHTAMVMRALHRDVPGLRTMLAMFESPDPDRHTEWLRDVDILAVRLPAFDPEHAERFRQQGKSVWLYVSSPVHPYPGLVIDEPGLGPRLLPWIARKHRVEGLLYWCVNYWKRGDPWSQPANYVAEQNGNGSLYYPAPDGPVPSLRLALLRDGIEDFDYFAILDGLLERASSGQRSVPPEVLETARDAARVPDHIVENTRRHTRDPDTLLEHREALARAIEALATRLR